MFKKFLSLLLAVMMVVSVMAVGVVTSSAATTDGFTPDPSKLYFDVDGTGWTMGATDKVAFHIFGGDLDTEANPSKPISWGGRKSFGTATAGETGIFEVDPTDSKKHAMTFTPGVQYKIIFIHIVSNSPKEQTYDLFFTTDCFGHVGYSDGKMLENPVDSSKQALAAYWRDMDASEYGPVKAITSIGNVVGSCLEKGKTDYMILHEFFTEEKDDFKGKTNYQNAHGYVCEISETSPGYKTEQKLIDDIGAGLGLTKDDVKAVMEEEDVVAKLEELPCSWSYDNSTLPARQPVHTHTPGDPVIENDQASTCTVQGSYDEVVYCTECHEEISRETKYHELAPHTAGDPVIENDHASTCTVQGAYDEVTYCTVCKGEISRETKYHDLAPHTPGEPTQDMMAGYPATCTEDGLKVMVTRCTVCSAELERQDVEIKAEGHKLHFVPEVPATATKNGMAAHYACENCDKLFADADGAVEVTAESLIIPSQFVRGDVNNDGVFDALDVTALQRKLVNYDLESYNAEAADADCDGVVDVIDVTLMQRVLANITTWEAWDAKHQQPV